MESFTWRSPLQLAAYRDRERGATMQFHYGQGRLPLAVTVQDASDCASYLLGYDQVGSLKAVAAMDGPREGRVVKLVDYDSFGQILSDSNPNLFLPIAFAGGLRDRFTGLVRFLHRDYDPMVGRFTAPDPLGDTGGDHDLYDYCVDEPVGRVDPEGLFFGPIIQLLKKAKTFFSIGKKSDDAHQKAEEMRERQSNATKPSPEHPHGDWEEIEKYPDKQADFYKKTIPPILQEGSGKK